MEARKLNNDGGKRGGASGLETGPVGEDTGGWLVG